MNTKNGFNRIDTEEFTQEGWTDEFWRAVGLIASITGAVLIALGWMVAK